jgi:hypothetical protein
MKRSALYRVILAPLILLAMCTLSPVSVDTGGSSSEVVAVVGQVLDAEGAAAVGALVSLRASDALGGTDGALARGRLVAASVRTDHAGRYRIDSVDAGEYTIAIVDQETNAASRIDTTIRSDTHMSTMSLPTAVLAPAASIRGSIYHSASVVGVAVVRVYGLDMAQTLDPVDGTFHLHGLPAGEWTLRIEVESPEYGAIERTVADLRPGETRNLGVLEMSARLDEDYTQWRHQSRLTFEYGGAVTTDLTNFPLLLRLDQSTLDFSRAHAKGHDIRFADSADEPLEYEIEHWDDDSRRAAVWVRIPRVAAGRQNMVLNMYWGRDSASDFSSASRVFAPEAGFAGVWHMEISGGRYPDATGNGNDGRGALSSAGAAGLIGQGQRFDGVDDYIDCGADQSLALSDSLTLYAWVKLEDIARNRYHRIVSKKDPWDSVHGYELECNPRLNDTGGSMALIGADSGYIRSFFDWDASWRLSYLDFWHGPLRQGDSPLRIGGIGAGDYLDGMLDEIRVSRVPRSESWVRLCYETQRPQAALLSHARVR